MKKIPVAFPAIRTLPAVRGLSGHCNGLAGHCMRVERLFPDIRFARAFRRDFSLDSKAFPDFGAVSIQERRRWESPSIGRPADDLGDLVLALSIRRHVTGYALLRFRDLLPLQFGLVDVRKTDKDEVQQKALEIAAALRELRQQAPLKLQQVFPNGNDDDDDDDDHADDYDDDGDGHNGLKEKASTPPDPARPLRWVVAVDDSTVDRSPPTNSRENQAQRTLAMLQGLVIADCKRIFKTAPQIVHPRRSRLWLGIRGLGPGARKEAFEMACHEVANFPVVRHLSGTLSDDTLLMSDSWATAKYAQRTVLLADRRSDQQLMFKLRKEALASKQLKKINEVIGELHPRRESRDLSEVLETRVDKMVDRKLNRLLDQELMSHKSLLGGETGVDAAHDISMHSY
eukprot:TRINITY_DN4633_c0_g1_i1.p1 TRINITY_DN4633_c0_g1~~TRINITY_DN4633_c0_g1_i1.p1  ORF type:complete len:400 (-),score=71.60 TRINITY_DN4633_c0_g1_i1:212-1411(-)